MEIVYLIILTFNTQNSHIIVLFLCALDFPFCFLEYSGLTVRVYLHFSGVLRPNCRDTSPEPACFQYFHA